MKTLVDDEVHTDYGQILVRSGADVDFGLDDAFSGSEGVGLCGTAIAGNMLLLTGMSYGGVGFLAELHDSRPALDQTWEEIVEVSFRPLSESTRLWQWNSQKWWDLGLQQSDYRVRYCAIGMDAARRMNNRDDGEPQTDRYLLQFWPAPPEPARVIKQTSAAAASSHESAHRAG